MRILPSQWVRTFMAPYVFVVVGAAVCALGSFCQPDSDETHKARRLEMVALQNRGKNARGQRTRPILLPAPENTAASVRARDMARAGLYRRSAADR